MDEMSRRRRRTASPSARYLPAELVARQAANSRQRIGQTELAVCTAVVLVASALIALIWMVTAWTVQEQQAELREQAERSLSGQAAVVAETVSHELMTIDQSLIVIQEAWRIDSDSVDLETWHSKLPALMAVTDDLFIADEKHIIRQDILPKAVGQGVGAAYVTFPHGSLEQFQSDGTPYGELSPPRDRLGPAIDAREFLIYVVRPLDHPLGWLVGASYRSKQLARLFAAAQLGYNPVVGLIDTRRGVVQAIIGPAARRPRTDLSKSKLYSIVERSPSGTWLGETAIDGIERLNAFHQVPGRDMAVLVAANWAEVMAPARELAAGAHALALLGSFVVVVIGGLVLWEVLAIREKRRRQRRFDRNSRELGQLRGEQTELTAKTRIIAARLQAVLHSTTDSMAILDPGLRLIEWNRAFASQIGQDLHSDMPLDTLLRAQYLNSQFGEVADGEAEIARRVALLRTGETTGLAQRGADGSLLFLRGVPVAEGGLLLVLNARSASPAETGRSVAAQRPGRRLDGQLGQPAG